MNKSEVIKKFCNGILGTYSTQNKSLTSVNGIILKSYNTIIARYDGSKYIVTDNKKHYYSKTTSTQTNELIKQLEENRQAYKLVYDVNC